MKASSKAFEELQHLAKNVFQLKLTVPMPVVELYNGSEYTQQRVLGWRKVELECVGTLQMSKQ